VLSQKRADKVMQFMISQGVRPSLVSEQSFGVRRGSALLCLPAKRILEVRQLIENSTQLSVAGIALLLLSFCGPAWAAANPGEGPICDAAAASIHRPPICMRMSALDFRR
jgi:hypothetical protein